MQNSSFRFTLGSEFFQGLIEQVEKLDAERAALERKIRTSIRPTLGRKAQFPAGWVQTDESGHHVSTGFSENIVSDLIETAFWASIKREEGRELRFSIVFRCPNDLFENVDSDADLDYLFAEAVPLDPAKIAKLAPAIPDGFSILVSADRNERLFVKGFTPTYRADLRVSVIDPAMLTINYKGDNIAVVSGEQTAFIRFSSFSVNTTSVWASIFGGGDKNYHSFADLRVRVLEHALRRMRYLRHGGAMIIVPRNQEKLGSIEKPSYASSPSYTYGRDLIAIENEKRGDTPFYQSPDLSDLGNRIGRLTAVDGATLLTKDLEVIAFGVKLRGRKVPKRIYRIDPLIHDESFKVVELDQIGNLRHQSAAKYVTSQSKSIALVVSQDGNISSFHWERHESNPKYDALHMHTRLELVLL